MMTDSTMTGNTTIAGDVYQPLAHDSAVLHVTGRAHYTDDMAEPRGTLYAALGLSAVAHGRIERLDLTAVRAAPGVVAVLGPDDVPGCNNIGPVIRDEPLFAEDTILYHGQALFAVAATTIEAARRAAHLAEIEVSALTPILTIEQALAAGSYVEPPTAVMRKGDAARAIQDAPRRLTGQMTIGGQEHFYLEGQVALAIPGDDQDMLVWSSTQHPSEVQHIVATVLGLADHAVNVKVRRMGGAFGGKETQANQTAAAAALLAWHTGSAVKLRLDRDDDMRLTGKRHDFLVRYTVGYDDNGRLIGLDIMLAGRCGCSADLSAAINDRAMFHIDNCYFTPHVTVTSHRLKTNTPSNTAFRGFGGPQGMVVAEQIIDEVARALGLDPLAVRRRNLYGGPVERRTTHYGMVIEDFIADALIEHLCAASDYAARRAEIAAFNARSPIIKRGLALTPVKFGISFTTTFLNQAGALVHIYKDGSVYLNHGGTEMGQGLFTKVAQIAAHALSLDISRIKISATDTAKVPNTSPTAASSGTDLNGMAVQRACASLRDRLLDFAAQRYQSARQAVELHAGRVTVAGVARERFEDLVLAAYLARIPLSATGYYATPKISWDRARGSGRPFYYFAYGAACSEVAIDTLTGEYRHLRTDILHDAGRSLNPALDRGQIEGGFVQGLGWLTCEELVYRADGALWTHAPATYKIPTAGDVPRALRVELWQQGENVEDTVHKSKAVGEPPFMLAISALHAIRDAVASVGADAGQGTAPRRVHLNAPATPEAVLMAVGAMRGAADAAGAPAPVRPTVAAE